MFPRVLAASSSVPSLPVKKILDIPIIKLLNVATICKKSIKKLLFFSSVNIFKRKKLLLGMKA
jgi:hypothetical protein